MQNMHTLEAIPLTLLHESMQLVLPITPEIALQLGGACLSPQTPSCVFCRSWMNTIW